MQLRFENIDALWCLVPLAALALLMWRQRRRYRSPKRRRIILVALGLAACAVALARPQMGHYAAAQRSLRTNLFLAIDISKSMLAEDISPSRLGFSMAFTRKLLETLPGIRVALFPFAADGYLQMPLSTDVQAANDLITSLNPSMVTTQGTDFTASLETLLEIILHMQQRTKDSGSEWAPTQVLLLSDGETHRPVEDRILKKFRAQHIPIFTVGIGTTNGAFIPVESRFGSTHENLRDREGRTVRSRLEPESLRKIAQITEGDYFSSRFEEVYQLGQRLMQSMKIGRLTATFKAEKELFPMLLMLAICLLAMELAFGRWEYLLRALIALFLVTTPRNARALSEETLAELQKASSNHAVRAYNIGLNRLKQNNLPEAIELFQEAVVSAENNHTRKQALYNLGNALLRLGDPVQAIQNYQQAFDIKSGDGRFDREANDRISKNIVLAAKLEEEMKRQQKEGDGEGKDKQGASDPKGPRQNYQPQNFDDTQKQRMYDLVSSEEQQILQRLQGKKNAKPLSPPGGKEW